MNMLSTFTNQRCAERKIMGHFVPFKNKEAYDGILYGGVTFLIYVNLFLLSTYFYLIIFYEILLVIFGRY